MKSGRFAISSPKMRAAFFLGSAGAVALGFLLYAWFFPFGMLQQADLWVQDRLVRVLPQPEPPEGMVLVALDEASLNLDMVEPEELEASPVLQRMSESFPWSREVYAALVEKVLEAGARAVVLDVLFPLPGTGDDVFAEVLERHADRVVLASQIDGLQEWDGHGGVLVSEPSLSILPEEQEPSMGFVNFWADPDAVVRWADYRKSLSEAAGGVRLEHEPLMDSLAAATLRVIGEGEAIPDEPVRLRFLETAQFPSVALWNLFVPELWERNLGGGEWFRDKVVVFGPTAGRFQDFHRTPVEGLMPGPVLHLNAMAAALRGDFLSAVTGGGRWAMVVVFCFLAAGLALLWRQPYATITGFTIFLLGYLGVCVLVLHWGDFFLPYVSPSAAFLFTGVFCFAYDFSVERKARARARRTLERYVSKDIVGEILDNPSSYLEELGGVRKNLTILFSDLRGFTALTERSDPSELVSQLNEYLHRMVEIVFRYQGTVDKFIGDAVMAVWGTVRSKGVEGDAADAVGAAVEMLKALEELNRKWETEGRVRLRAGIGLHSGEAIFGNMGSEQKMEPTVIGDAVNLASRLEGLCKTYGVSLVFSSQVKDLLPAEFAVRTLDLVRVVGRTEPVEIFSAAIHSDGCPLPGPWLDGMEEAIRLYRAARFGAAKERFAGLTEEMPEDPIALLFLKRCEENLRNPAGENWSPVVELSQK